MSRGRAVGAAVLLGAALLVSALILRHRSPEALPDARGRPLRKGGGWVNARPLDARAALVSVRVVSDSGALAWETPVGVGAEVGRIVLVDSDTRGNVFVGVEAGPDTVVVRLTAAGTVSGTARIAGFHAPADPQPLTISGEGTVLLLRNGHWQPLTF